MRVIHALSRAERGSQTCFVWQETRQQRWPLPQNNVTLAVRTRGFFFFSLSFFFPPSTGKRVHMMCSAEQRSSNPHSCECFPWYSPGQWLTMTSAWTVRFVSLFVERADAAHLRSGDSQGSLKWRQLRGTDASSIFCLWWIFMFLMLLFFRCCCCFEARNTLSERCMSWRCKMHVELNVATLRKKKVSQQSPAARKQHRLSVLFLGASERLLFGWVRHSSSLPLAKTPQSAWCLPLPDPSSLTFYFLSKTSTINVPLGRQSHLTFNLCRQTETRAVI